MVVRFVLAAATLACGFGVVVGFGCSSFAETEDANDAGESDATGISDDADADGADALSRPSIDCDASHCRASTERYVFVTLGGLPGNFANGGDPVATANQFCGEQANADFTHPDLAGRSWLAWLCLDTEGAVGRVVQGPATWTRPDGTVAFATSAVLQGGTANASIGTAGTRVWTGCDAQSFGEPSDFTCANWSDPSMEGTYGIADHTDNGWSAFNHEACTEHHSIYCFESN